MKQDEMEQPFFVLGRIEEAPRYEDGSLWVRTRDFHCSQDSRWPCSLDDAYFHEGEIDPDNWLNISPDCLRVLVLGLYDNENICFTKKKHRKYLTKAVRRRAKSILAQHTEREYVREFLEKQLTDRPRSKTRAKRT